MNLPKIANGSKVVQSHEPSPLESLSKHGDGPIPFITRDNRIPHNLPPGMGHGTGMARPPAGGSKKEGY